MSTEMEDRIRQWVDTEVAGVDPVTLDEVLDRAAAPTTEPNEAAAGSRRRWLIPAVAAAAVILVAAVGFVALGGSDEPQELVVASPDGEDATDDIPASEPEGPEPTDDGWVDFTEPTFGWTWEQPESWTTQSESDYCGAGIVGLSQTLVTNTDRRISHPIVASGCNSTWDLPQPLPGGFLGVSVTAMDDTMEMLGDFPTEPTEFPLDADDLKPYEGPPIGVLPDRMIVINHEGRRYSVSTFEGPDVADDDRAALERLVESIDPSGLPAAHPIEFGWLPAGVTVVEGPPPPVAATARLEFNDGEAGVDESRSVQVDARTIRGALLFARADVDADAPEAEPELLPGVTASRERIQVRGVEAVHDRAVDGDTSVSRLVFFEHDNLAVEVLAQNVTDDDLYRIIEGLHLVAVGGPSG